MQRYIGTKVVHAKPMTQQEFAVYMGQVNKSNLADHSPKGYLVEYQDGGEPNHPDHDNYISWSPADVFDRAYVETDGMDFGAAINCLKKGMKVSRQGWNGKDMFLYFVRGGEFPVSRNPGSAIKGHFDKDLVPYRDYIAILTAQNDVVPWSCAMSDMLAADWYIVD